MKQHFAPVMQRLFLMMLLMAVQFSGWAIDNDTESSNASSTGSLFTQPWIWIGLIVVTIIVLIGPLNHKDFTVTMKKRKDLKNDHTVYYQRSNVKSN